VAVKNGKKTEYKRDPRTGRFIRGTAPGPGRPRGRKDFWSNFQTAVEAIAKDLKTKKDPEQICIEIVKRGIIEALKGKYRFWCNLMDRLFGKPKITIESNEEREKLEKLEEIAEAIKKIAEK